MTAAPRFSANIGMMFAERSFLDRIDAAAKAGFKAVECHFPYEFAIPDIRARLSANGLVMNGLNTAPGDVGRGEWGMAAMPGRQETFREHLAQALDYASALGVGNVHCMSGVIDEADRPAARDAFLANMAYASDEARKAGVTLLVEPLNVRDKPGYFVARSDEVVALLAALGRDNVTLLFDVYHVQVMEGDLLKRLERHWPRIGHIQIAAAPSRHEPDEGEIAYPAVIRAILDRGWTGWIGAEYRPRARTEDGLGWLAAYRQA